MINSRNLSDLIPEAQSRAHAFIAACAAQGIDVLVTSTYRDRESQAALYAQGRTTPGQVVTHAPAGHSYHNYRCALDFVPIVNGKAQWSDLKLFAKCGAIAESCGLEWAGRWITMKEMAHVQYTGGLSIADLLAGKAIPAAK